MLGSRNKPRTLRDIRLAKERDYRYLNSIGVTAQVRKVGRRIERLEAAIEASDGGAEVLKEALRAEIRRFWAVCPADVD